MNKVSSRRRDRLGRMLDSGPVYAIAALILLVLLASFYAVLLVNMNAIDTKTEDLKQHPYAVTVASGRTETLLMQIRTLDDRLAFTRTPETVASVKTDFAIIDTELKDAIDTIAKRCRGNAETAQALVDEYSDLRIEQQKLVSLSLSDASDEMISDFLSYNINPRIDVMVEHNDAIMDNASQSFDRLYNTVAATRVDAITTATVLMAAVVIALVLFFLVIRRKNRQQEALQGSLRRAVATAMDASEAKSKFLSNVSHDIRTPLTAIMGLTDIAFEHADDEKRVRESLGKVQLSSHHLLNLVNDVLDMSKIESGQIDLGLTPFDIRSVVETLTSIVRPQADTKHLTFAVSRVEVANGLVMGDEMRVSQVLINLLGNAVKYTEPGGLVNFEVEELTGEELERFIDEHGLPAAAIDEDGGERPVRLVRFVVEDDGIGMSKEFMARMFDPFEREDVPTRLSVEGTGLGMAIVKNLADLMGGTITVQSQCGKGSCFALTLPFVACEGEECEEQLAETMLTEHRAASEPVENQSWSHVHALLAEDNEIIGEIAEEMIMSTGATAERAWNGLEVLELLEGEPEDRFDLIFMDIQMPGMDGLEAARTIVERYAKAGRKRPPIIATTANAYVEDRQRAFEAGMDGFAVKPIGVNEVRHLFQTFVDRPGDE